MRPWAILGRCTPLGRIYVLVPGPSFPSRWLAVWVGRELQAGKAKGGINCSVPHRSPIRSDLDVDDSKLATCRDKNLLPPAKVRSCKQGSLLQTCAPQLCALLFSEQRSLQREHLESMGLFARLLRAASNFFDLSILASLFSCLA